jgi:hypothetical protein
MRFILESPEGVSALFFQPEPEGKADPGPVQSGLSVEPTEWHTTPRPAGTSRWPNPFTLVLTVLVALIGGVFGILGAVLVELQPGSLLLAPFVLLLPVIGAPIIEEALKPVGVYVLQARWPRWLHGAVHTAFLGGLAGLTFGIVEAFAYVYSVDNPSDRFITYRFTLPLVLHTVCSLLVGLGITRGVISWANGENPLPGSSRNLYLAAVLIHGTYNATVIMLDLTNAISFD